MLLMKTAISTAESYCVAPLMVDSLMTMRTTMSSIEKYRWQSGRILWTMDSVEMWTAIRSSTAPTNSAPTSRHGSEPDMIQMDLFHQTLTTMGTGGWRTPPAMRARCTGGCRHRAQTMPVTDMTGSGGAGSLRSTTATILDMGSSTGL